ncbi:MAG: hypothetical protein AB1567_00805 [bacterium]
MNYFKAVFWDYPQFSDEMVLKEHLDKKKSHLYPWILYHEFS